MKLALVSLLFFVTSLGVSAVHGYTPRTTRQLASVTQHSQRSISVNNERESMTERTDKFYSYIVVLGICVLVSYLITVVSLFVIQRRQ